jgi:hypothetical protein
LRLDGGLDEWPSEGSNTLRSLASLNDALAHGNSF